MEPLFFMVIDSVDGRPRYYVVERGIGGYFHIVAKCKTQQQTQRIVEHLNRNVIDTAKAAVVTVHIKHEGKSDDS